MIVMRTFSKGWGLPGIRLGFITGKKDIINYISKCRSLVETNSFSYEIAKWALKNPKILKQHVRDVKEGYNFLVSKFKEENEIFHGGKKTNAILLKLKSKKQIISLKNQLSRKRFM